MPRMTKALPIRALALDFDGTLVDSNEIKHRAFFEVVADVPGAAPLMREILEDPNAGDRYSIFRRLAEKLAERAPDASQLIERYGSRCEEQILRALDESALDELFGDLSRSGYAAFVVSATPERDLRSLLQRTALPSRLRGVFGRPRSKVDILEALLTEQGWQSGELLVVGDQETDQLAARKAGCPFVGVGPDLDGLERPPKHRLPTVFELPALLRERASRGFA